MLEPEKAAVSTIWPLVGSPPVATQISAPLSSFQMALGLEQPQNQPWSDHQNNGESRSLGCNLCEKQDGEERKKKGVP